MINNDFEYELSLAGNLEDEFGYCNDLYLSSNFSNDKDNNYEDTYYTKGFTSKYEIEEKLPSDDEKDDCENPICNTNVINTIDFYNPIEFNDKQKRKLNSDYLDDLDDLECIECERKRRKSIDTLVKTNNVSYDDVIRYDNVMKKIGICTMCCKKVLLVDCFLYMNECVCIKCAIKEQIPIGKLKSSLHEEEYINDEKFMCNRGNHRISSHLFVRLTGRSGYKYVKICMSCSLKKKNKKYLKNK